jgi:hypothetical protein
VGINHGGFCCSRAQGAVAYLGCATDLVGISFTGTLRDVDFAILSDTRETKRPPEGGLSVALMVMLMLIRLRANRHALLAH